MCTLPVEIIMACYLYFLYSSYRHFGYGCFSFCSCVIPFVEFLGRLSCVKWKPGKRISFWILKKVEEAVSTYIEQ